MLDSATHLTLDRAAVREAEFPALAPIAYLNHASDSPLPSRSARVMEERTALLTEPLRTVPAREGYLAAAQEQLGSMLRAAPSQLAFLTNVADATATIANGIDWRQGDEIVLVADELASFVYPWRNLAAWGVRCVFVPKTGVANDLARIEAAFTPRTRLLAISHVEFQSGFKNDLTAIGRLCRDRDALFVVDASQSLGVQSLDVECNNIDAAVAIGYKWLMAPHGISLLYIAERAMEQVRPTVPGRYSVEAGWKTADYPLDWFPDARRYQGGALNWIGLCALATSVRLLTEVGPEAVAAASSETAADLVGRLESLPVEITSDLWPAHRSQIVAFTFGSAAADDAFVSRAADAGVILGRRGCGVRVGTHFWTNGVDLDRLCDVIETHAVEAERRPRHALA